MSQTGSYMTEQHPPINGVEYPEKPEDPSALEMYQYMERVDHYFAEKGSQKLDSGEGDEEASSE